MITCEFPAPLITKASKSPPVAPNTSKFADSTDTNGCSRKTRVSGVVSVFESDEFKKSGRLPSVSVPRTSSTGSSLSSRSESISSTGSSEATQGFYCKSAPPYDCELPHKVCKNLCFSPCTKTFCKGAWLKSSTSRLYQFQQPCIVHASQA